MGPKLTAHLTYAGQTTRVLRVEVLGGTSIETACQEAVSLRRIHGKNIEFTHNEVTLTAKGRSTPEDLVQEWERRSSVK